MRGETDGGVGDDTDARAAAAEGAEEALLGVLVGIDDGAVEENQSPVDELIAAEASVRSRVAKAAAHGPPDVADRWGRTSDGKVIRNVVAMERGEDVRMEAASSDG